MMKMNNRKIRLIIREAINRLVSEIVDGGSPDEFEFEGERYVALEDESFPILYHNGEWKSDGETHRDIISDEKFGCQEWELEYRYSQGKLVTVIYPMLDMLWSGKSGEFKYPSRIFWAKGETKKRGIEYILVSWDKLNENLINDICRQFYIDRDKLIYVDL